MFSSLQYRATGQCLLRAFPNKPRSSATIQYNNTYIFNELDKVNSLRNRIAHHEPICFRLHKSEIDISYIINEYQKIQTLFSWMGIDSYSMLYGLDHVQNVCAKINSLKWVFVWFLRLLVFFNNKSCSHLSVGISILKFPTCK